MILEIQEINKTDNDSLKSLNDQFVDKCHESSRKVMKGIELYIKFAIEIEDSGIGMTEE